MQKIKTKLPGREPVDAQCISQARKFSFQLGFIIFAELLILLDGIMLICRFFSYILLGFEKTLTDRLHNVRNRFRAQVKAFLGESDR